MNPKELRGLYEAYKKVNAPQDISEISANLALTASQKADEERRKAAVSGDKERAAEKAAQASRLYKGVGPRRAKERMAEAVRGKKNDGNLANNYPPYDKVTRGDVIAGATGKDQMGGKNIRGNDSKAQKARLEKKRGMKLDDHPQFKEEFELDQLIESLVERGHTEQEAYALVAQFTLDEIFGLGGKSAKDRLANSDYMKKKNKEADEKAIQNLRDMMSKDPERQKRPSRINNEGYQRNPEKGEKEDKKYTPVRGEKTPMPPRGNKRREDFEKWYAKQMGR